MRTCNYLPLGRIYRAGRRAWRRLLALRGRRFCPACGRHAWAFLPFPAKVARRLAAQGFPIPTASAAWETFNREEYACPFCDASDRERLYALYLQERLGPAGGAELRLLDIGPTPPLTACLRRFRVRHRTADIENPAVDDRVDICDMPIYQDASFDIVLCSHVLEHVLDDRKAMAELFRVLRPGGWGIVMSPIPAGRERTDEDPTVTDVSERLRRFGQEGHVRLYAQADFTRRLQQAGFRVTRLDSGHFGREQLIRCGITPHGALYVVEKPGESAA